MLSLPVLEIESFDWKSEMMFPNNQVQCSLVMLTAFKIIILQNGRIIIYFEYCPSAVRLFLSHKGKASDSPSAAYNHSFFHSPYISNHI